MTNPELLHINSRSGSEGRWWLMLRLMTGLALLTFVFTRGASVKEVIAAFAGADGGQLAFALGIALLGEGVTAYKWKLLIESAGGHLPLKKAVRTSLIGMFYNNFFPGSVGGDIVRALIVAKNAGGKAAAAASTFMQRNTGLAALFFVGIPAALLWPRRILMPGLVENLRLEALLSSPLLWLGLALTGYIGVNLLLFSRYLYAAVWHYLHRISDAAAPEARVPVGRQALKMFIRRGVRAGFRKLQRFHQELHGYRFWQAGPLGLSVVTQMLDIFLIWNLAQALAISVSMTDLMVAVPLVTLANLLPITVNGIGLRETMYLALLTGAGVAPSQAVALGLLQFGVVLSLSSAGGVLHVFGKNAA